MRPLLTLLGSLRYFIWIIVPVLLYVGYQAWGLPHIAFNYTYHDDGRGYRPFAPDRWYVSCTYVGYFGPFKYEPRDGKCPWFKFYKKNAEDRS